VVKNTVRAMVKPTKKVRSKKSSIPQIALATAKVDWSQWDPWAGWQGLIGVAVCLAAGFFMGHAAFGAIAAGGALYIGLGTYDKQTRTSTSTMIFGSLFMSFAAMAGSLTGGQLWQITLLATLWAFGAGILSVLGPPLSFMGIKTLVAILIAGGYSSSWKDAMLRSILILSGCLLQTFLFFIEDSYLSRWGAPRRVTTPQPVWKKSLAILKSQLSFRSEVFQHALRLAFCILISQFFCRSFLTHNSYWLPLTIAIVMRPDFEQVFSRAVARMIGTVIGAVLTTLIVIWLKPDGITLAFLALPCVWLCFSSFKANYILYSVCITAYVVFMLSFVGLPEMSVLINRLIATLSGGFLALLVYAIWPRPGVSK
jgi:hypothetical protein